MKKRIPVDVEFLLESILSETPDGITITNIDKQKFDKLGIDSEVGTTYHYEPDARAFFLAKDGVVIYTGSSKTHGTMENAIRSVVFYAKSNMLFANKAVFIKDSNGIGIKSLINSGVVYFYGLAANDLEDIRKYFFKHNSYFRNLEIRGFDESRESFELAGRLWIEKNTISFWNTKDEWDKHMKNIFGFMEAMDMNPKKAIYEFIDSRNFWTYGELSGEEPEAEKEKLSPEEIKKLQAAQHLDPKAKAKLFGPEYKEKHKEKASRGFDFPAQADAARPAREGHIKLKDLLKENPDFVKSQDNAKIAQYYDADAIAFFAYPQFSILNRGGVHSDIMNAFQNVHGDFENYSDNPSEVEYLIDEKGLIVSDAKGLLDAIDIGPLGEYLDIHNPFDDGDGDDERGSDESSPEVGAFRTKSGGLAGRVWTKKKIISFWNRREDVVKRWNEIEKMFNDLSGMLGDLNDYRVDWLERDVNTKSPMTPASEVSSGGSGEKTGQTTFLDKLFGDEKISDDEIKKLQARLHTLPAKEKKKVMMQMGYKNMKAAEIAEKLGMTVAEFNHIMNVNESDGDQIK